MIRLGWTGGLGRVEIHELTAVPLVDFPPLPPLPINCIKSLPGAGLHTAILRFCGSFLHARGSPDSGVLQRVKRSTDRPVKIAQNLMTDFERHVARWTLRMYYHLPP